jgi:hypothetical protein
MPVSSSEPPGGYILLFTQSYAFAWDGPMSGKRVIAQWEREQPATRVGEHKTLLV